MKYNDGMKKLTIKQKQEIELVCYSVVTHLFAMMHNPKYRGSAFTWEKFPEMMRSQCASRAFMNLVLSADTKAVEAYAGDFGFKVATKMVTTMQE